MKAFLRGSLCIVFVMLFLVACSSSPNTNLHYLLIDRTGQWKASDMQHFQHALQKFRQLINDSEQGEQVVVATMNDSTTQVEVIFSAQKPAFGLLDNPHAPSAKKKLQDFEQNFKKGIKHIEEAVKAPSSGVASPIIEVLNEVSKQIDRSLYHHVTLVVFSDMIQNSELVNFRGITKNEVMKKLNKQQLVPDMNGINVYIYGIGNFDFRINRKNSAKKRKYMKSALDSLIRRNELIWRYFFKASHASLKDYLVEPLVNQGG